MTNCLEQNCIESILQKMSYRVLDGPGGLVCKHWVVLVILDELERNGYKINSNLVKSLVKADDEESLHFLKEGLYESTHKVQTTNCRAD